MSNEEKSTQLGMPYGTANAKLRKIILFNLVQRYGEDSCYQCNNKIEKIEEFSIEHIKPWFGNSTTLFWDFANIAFSHISCNVRAARKPFSKNRIAPDGMWWCSEKKHYVSLANFYTSGTKISKRCKPCDIESVDRRRRARGERPATPKFLKGSKY